MDPIYKITKDEIEILKFRTDGISGNVKAFLSIRLFGFLVIHGFKIIQQPNQKPWVSVSQSRSPLLFRAPTI